MACGAERVIACGTEGPFFFFFFSSSFFERQRGLWHMGQGAIVRRTEGTMVGGTEFVRQRAWHVGQGAIVRWTEEAMVDET